MILGGFAIEGKGRSKKKKKKGEGSIEGEQHTPLEPSDSKEEVASGAD